ncbi:hypothetical protein Tco_0929830, partial [Tanacetum coccineum]
RSGVPLLQFVLPELRQCHQQSVAGWQPKGYGMIHNDEDGDNDAYDADRDDDVREMRWYYETIKWHPKDPPDPFGDELGFLQ